MMQFYMTPGSCSTGIHILLEELELIFSAHIIDLIKGDNRSASYLAINEHGTIPCLVTDDQGTYKDYLGIAHYLARHNPKKPLLPESTAESKRVLQACDLVLRVIHGEGFVRYFVPERHSGPGKTVAEVQEEGLGIVRQTLPELDNMLTDSGYFSSSFSIADPTVFYVCFWAVKSDLELPGGLQHHFSLMLKRPSVRQVLAEEGYGHFLRSQS